MVVVHGIGAQIHMVVSLQHHVDAQLREQALELLAHGDNFLVVVVGAVGVGRLVQNNDLPLGITAVGAVPQPIQLRLGKSLLGGGVVGVEHHEVDVVVVVVVVHAAVRILFGYIGQDEVLIQCGALLFVVAGGGHIDGAQEHIRGNIRQPFPLVDIGAVVHLIARADHKIGVGVHGERRFQHRMEPLVLLGVLGLGVGGVQESDRIGIVRRLDHARLAPPISGSVTHTVAVFRAGRQPCQGNGVAVQRLFGGHKADNAQIHAGEGAVVPLGDRRHPRGGGCTAEARRLAVGYKLDVRAAHTELGVPADIALGGGVLAHGHGHDGRQAVVVPGGNDLFLFRRQETIPVLAVAVFGDHTADHIRDGMSDGIQLALGQVFANEVVGDAVDAVEILDQTQPQNRVDDVGVALVAPEDQRQERVEHRECAVTECAAGEEGVDVEIQTAQKCVLQKVVEQQIIQEVEQIVGTLTVFKVVEHIHHKRIVLEVLIAAEKHQKRTACGILQRAGLARIAEAVGVDVLGAGQVGHGKIQTLLHDVPHHRLGVFLILKHLGAKLFVQIGDKAHDIFRRENLNTAETNVNETADERLHIESELGFKCADKTALLLHGIEKTVQSICQKTHDQIRNAVG